MKQAWCTLCEHPASLKCYDLSHSLEYRPVSGGWQAQNEADAINLAIRMANKINEIEQELKQAKAHYEADHDELRRVATVRDEAIHLLSYARHLRENGEQAPGGDETWDEFDRKTETFLRSLTPPEQEPWRPTEGADLGQAVRQALGSASMCWTSTSTAGEFDSARCDRVADGIIAWLNDWADEARRKANEATYAKAMEAENWIHPR